MEEANALSLQLHYWRILLTLLCKPPCVFVHRDKTPGKGCCTHPLASAATLID